MTPAERRAHPASLPQRRWRCPCCRTEGWSATGATPSHGRYDGPQCRAWDARLAQAAAERAAIAKAERTTP